MAARDKDGRVALHYAAFSGNLALIDMLLSAPSLSTPNRVTKDGKTPLLVAVEFDQPAALARLVPAQASQSAALGRSDYQCPFQNSVVERKEDLVLSLVLAAEGEEKRAARANRRAIMGLPMPSLAAGSGILPNVKVFLAAGAIETNTNPAGHVASDNVGTLTQHGSVGPREEAAIKRELQLGPAYRARSLLWPRDETGDADDGGAAAPLGLRIHRRSNPKLSFRTIQSPLTQLD
eukprot:g11627.t1